MVDLVSWQQVGVQGSLFTERSALTSLEQPKLMSVFDELN